MKKIKLKIWRIKVKIHQIGKKTKRQKTKEKNNAVESVHKG